MATAKAMRNRKWQEDPATRAYLAGCELLWAHPVFAPLQCSIHLLRADRQDCPPDGWAQARYEAQQGCRGSIHAHPRRLAGPGEWAYCLGRAALAFALEHFQRDRADWRAWCAACDVVAARFMLAMRLGSAPEHMQLPGNLPQRDEAQWYRHFCEAGVPGWAKGLSLAGSGTTLALPAQWPRDEDACASLPAWQRRPDWPALFAEGIANSVTQSVEMAAGVRTRWGGPRPRSSALELARNWFMDSFPLLGGMVAAFEFVEDAGICRREDISVAAVDEALRTIYINPAAALDEQELRFVVAHEVLHVALRHLPRRRGRDPYLWNVACDFVINDWLVQMGVGRPPAPGLLFDIELRGMSAETVYERIATDLRRMRKLRTLAGSQGDMLERRARPGAGVCHSDLDDFYRTQLGKGLLRHEQGGRGLLPAGLLEEIRALLQPPIDWQVHLARWFDAHFPPVHTVRSYARASRRQSATPDIPRPRVQPDARWLEGRTFGVVLDTSGSMDRHTLAKGLGAIAGYAQAKEVPAVRLVCCDAAAYDMGYMPASDIAHRVRIQGRGGTVLQPGVKLLLDARDFPPDGPILIITDGDCDHLRVPREHAYLLPPGARLPFRTHAPVFVMA